jgi:ABC-type branched-subunit amino acid transport system ATPase component/ABC-type branched-subunit amino acid transport system permease subunit
MQEFLRFALLGLGLGALYSLASQGLIVIYRGSGVLNLAHGAVGVVGAYIEWDLEFQHGQPTWLAWTVGLASCAVIGALVHLLIMRQLKRASPLARIVVTLGILIALQAAVVLRYGTDANVVPSALPRTLVHPFGTVVSVDRFVLLGVAAAMSVALWALYRYSRFGLATSAVAENQRAAASVGLSPDRVATINWAFGSTLAGLAAILVAPIVTLQVTNMTNLVLAAMAAALVAGFRSFPIAFVAGVIMGVGQTELTNYVSTSGVDTSLPFLVIIVWMVLQGKGLPLRDFFLQRLPAVGSGRVRLVPVVVTVVLIGVLITQVSLSWQDAFVTTFATAIILLSVVVITGYAGQLSLCQFALAGFGALIAGRLVDAQGWPFLAALLAGIVATVLLGVLFALPAVRARGINLAIVTLGLGSGIELVVFGHASWVGGVSGTLIGKPSLFGWDFDAISHPDRYAIVCLCAFVLLALMVASLRRGRSGRRLLAVRTNERAAAALGISVAETKIYAFALSAGIAAVGGVLLAFRQDVVIYNESFTNYTSILVMAWAFIGGIGFLLGPVIGATLDPDSVGGRVVDAIFSGVDKYIVLIGGVFAILLVLQNQDGMAKEATDQLKWIARKLTDRVRLPSVVNRRRHSARPAQAVVLPSEQRQPVDPKTLEVANLTVRYGGVSAVKDVSFTVVPGQVMGLIGPNGAGKTSVIDAVTGFARAAGGSIAIAGRDVSKQSAARRARAGISRSFQSLELFEDLTVLDNLRTASDSRNRLSYLTDLFRPINPPLPGQVVAAIREFQLENDLMRTVSDLSYGQRRLLAIVRALATGPSVLLLDEPAAGLGDVESRELARLVRRLADEWGIAVLLVEHDMNFVMSICDRIVVLDFGTKIADGPPDDIRKDIGVIAAYLGETEQEFMMEIAAAPADGGRV